MSKSMAPTIAPLVNTRLCGAKSLWQITSLGVFAGDCQIAPSSAKPTLAS